MNYGRIENWSILITYRKLEHPFCLTYVALPGSCANSRRIHQLFQKKKWRQHLVSSSKLLVHIPILTPKWWFQFQTDPKDKCLRTNVTFLESWEILGGDAVGCAESLRIVAKAQQIQVGIHGSWIVIQQAPKIGKPQELLHGLEVNQVPCQDDLVNISWFRWLEKDCFPIESPEPT